MKKVVGLLAALLALLNSCSEPEPEPEGPLGMKIGQTYELSYYEYEETETEADGGLSEGTETKTEADGGLLFPSRSLFPERSLFASRSLTSNPEVKKYYRAFVVKVVDVGADWVEFQHRRGDRKFKMTGEEIEKKFINYKLQ